MYKPHKKKKFYYSVVCTNRRREKKFLLFYGLYKPQKRKFFFTVLQFIQTAEEKNFDMRFLQSVDFCHTPMHLRVVSTVNSYKWWFNYGFYNPLVSNILILNLRLIETVNIKFLLFLQFVKNRKLDTKYLDDDDSRYFLATHSDRRPPKAPSIRHSSTVGTSHHCHNFHLRSELHCTAPLPFKILVYISRDNFVIYSYLLLEF